MELEGSVDEDDQKTVNRGNMESLPEYLDPLLRCDVRPTPINYREADSEGKNRLMKLRKKQMTK